MSDTQEDLDDYPIAAAGDLSGQVPVIDVGALVRDPSAPAAREAVGEIAAACRKWGFFQIVHHGVAAELVEATWQATARFFSQPAPVKGAIMRSRDNPWGYYNNELTKNQRDKKEVFDFTTDGLDPIYQRENRWPLIDASFKATLCRYRDAVASLAGVLLEAFCVGLALPPDFLKPQFGARHTGFVRLNYYPVRDPLAGPDASDLPLADRGVHHHTDAGALTVLLQDDVGGLQVLCDGFWHDIEPMPGAFVINTGDMMQVWSNDLYQAAIHRVLAMEHSDRYSIPFFFNPAAHAIVDPLPVASGAGRPARYRPVSWSDFRSKRTDGDYSDYGSEVQIAQYRI